MKTIKLYFYFDSVFLNLFYLWYFIYISAKYFYGKKMASNESVIEAEKKVVEGTSTAVQDSSEEPNSSKDISDLFSPEGYILVDIGANLTNKKFSRDLDSVVQRARDSGVQKIMVTGTSLHTSKEALRLTRLFPGVLYCTAGLHPHEAKSWTSDCSSVLQELFANPECVAVGECGLDFNRNFSPPEVQLEVFEKQIQLASDLKKPLFIHEREAHGPLVGILEKYQSILPPTVIHCFTGSREEAEKYLKMGFYIGLTGYLWKDKSENGIRKLLEDGIIPLERLLLETDSPFMYPNTRASKLPAHIKLSLTEKSLNFLQRYCTFQRNEPCSLAVTMEMISACMQRPPEEVGLTTTYNALKVFGLST